MVSECAFSSLSLPTSHLLLPILNEPGGIRLKVIPDVCALTVTGNVVFRESAIWRSSAMSLPLARTAIFAGAAFAGTRSEGRACTVNESISIRCATCVEAQEDIMRQIGKENIKEYADFITVPLFGAFVIAQKANRAGAYCTVSFLARKMGMSRTRPEISGLPSVALPSYGGQAEFTEDMEEGRGDFRQTTKVWET